LSPWSGSPACCRRPWPSSRNRPGSPAPPLPPPRPRPLVHAEPAIGPGQLAAALLGLGGEGDDPVLRVGMVLLRDVAPVHGIGVRRLLGEGQRDGALVAEDGHVVAAARRRVDQAEGRRRARALVGGIHQEKGKRLLVGHRSLLIATAPCGPARAARSRRRTWLTPRHTLDGPS